MNILWAAAAKKEITITSVAVVLHPYGLHIESTILVAGLTVAAVLLIEKQCTLEHGQFLIMMLSCQDLRL